MADPKTGRAVSQDDWKRTQVRMPQAQYKAIMEHAEHNNLSLNTAMLELMDKGLNSKSHFDLIEETVTMSDQVIDKIADKVVERLNQK